MFWLVPNYINYVIALSLVISNVWKMLSCIWLPSSVPIRVKASFDFGHIFRDMEFSVSWLDSEF